MDEQRILQLFQQAAFNTMQAMATAMFQKSQENCPFVTGQLRNSAAIVEANPGEGSYTFSYNVDDTAPYVKLVEEGGRVENYLRRNRRTGRPEAVTGYDVTGKFFIKNAIEDVLSGNFDDVVVSANEGSSGYYISI